MKPITLALALVTALAVADAPAARVSPCAKAPKWLHCSEPSVPQQVGAPGAQRWVCVKLGDRPGPRCHKPAVARFVCDRTTGFSGVWECVDARPAPSPVGHGGGPSHRK